MGGWMGAGTVEWADRQADTETDTETDQCPTTAPFLLINNNVTRADYCTV